MLREAVQSVTGVRELDGGNSSAEPPPTLGVVIPTEVNQE